MIFVTVGTHEQPFDRLVKEIDRLVETKAITEEVIIQTGYSTYIPQFCTWSKFFSYKEMIKYTEKASIVITHGGPSSFIMPLQMGKIPVVVPRQKKYGEHVNDHQLSFVKLVDERMKNIISVYDISNLKEVILDYGKITDGESKVITSNNSKFNQDLEKIIGEIFIEQDGKNR